MPAKSSYINGSSRVAVGGSRCICFTLCQSKDAVPFLSALPQVIDHPSPWVGYLRAVYGHTVPLPFDMSNFSFFYHHDHLWPPHVQWPMATCDMNSSAPVSGTERCPPHECARWQSKTHETSVLAAQQRRGPGKWPSYSVVLSGNGQGTSRAAMVSNGFAPTQIAADHTWLEVHRMFSAWREGVDGYGCWFGGGAVGSGMWLNVGRTRVDCVKSFTTSARQEWQARKGLSAEARAHVQSQLVQLSRPVEMTWMDPHNTGEIIRTDDLSIFAAALGYNTTQCANAWGWPRLSELVLVNAACMDGTEPIRGCPPADVELRVGHDQAGRCTCLEPAWYNRSLPARHISHHQVPALNCDGVGRLRQHE